MILCEEMTQLHAKKPAFFNVKVIVVNVTYTLHGPTYIEPQTWEPHMLNSESESDMY